LPETEWYFGNLAKAEVAKNDRKYWEFRLEKETAFNDFVFFGAGQDWAILKFYAFQTISAKIQRTIQEWMPELPAYMQAVVVQDWQERGWVFPSKTRPITVASPQTKPLPSRAVAAKPSNALSNLFKNPIRQRPSHLVAKSAADYYPKTVFAVANVNRSQL
jgi:hypothetical protein